MKRPNKKRLALALTLAALSPACAGSRNSLGTAAGSCFRALPQARASIHDKGKLLGVRLVSSATLAQRLPSDAKLQALPKQDLCVFAFRGSYPPGAVTGADNTATRRYAIIALTRNRPEVVAASAVDELPTRFRHLS